MDSIFERVRDAVRITDVVERFGGLKLNRSRMACCPFHQEKTPSFSVKESEGIWKCFGCGASGDAVDFVAKVKNIDKLDAAKLLAGMYGVSEPAGQGKQRAGITSAKPKKQPRDASAGLKQGVREYILACAADAGAADYFIKRGLTQETVRRFKLGRDPKKQCAVIPYSSDLSYYQTRSIEGKEFRKPPTDETGPEPLWGAKALETKGAVFVMESPICAMSVIQCGGQAVSVCGATGGQKLLTAAGSKALKCTFVLCLDNDEPGRKAQQDLANQLFENNQRFVAFNIAGSCKDPNELLMKDPELLTKRIAEGARAARNKYRTRKDSIAADELFEQKYEPPRTVVDNLIVEGLTLFCAPQKIGKSWLVFDLCFTVASGADFWAYKTHPCDVLYYSLEDPEWRVIDRMKKLFKGKKPPKGVHIITESDKLGAGLLEHMQDEIDRNPKIGMVVVDTLKMVRKVNTKNNDIYGHDYEELSSIKKFSERNKLAIIVVHHNRKTKDESDPFANVLGTGGLTGAVDTTLVIMKNKRMKDRESTLSITGRDVKEREVVIEWGGEETWRWSMSGDAQEMQAKRERDEYENDPLVVTVKAMMKTQPYGWEGTPSEILRRIFDVTGNMAQSPMTIGQKIQKYKDRLYYDGICHEEKKVRGQKKHVYYKKNCRPPQYGIFDEKDSEE